jgi:hypothetical protein
MVGLQSRPWAGEARWDSVVAVDVRRRRSCDQSDMTKKGRGMKHIKRVGRELPVKALTQCQIKAAIAGLLASSGEEYDGIMRDKLCH